MSKDLNLFWDKRVPKEWRHIVKDIPEIKRERILKRVNSNFINHFKTLDIKSCIDWGCGGGLISKELLKYYKVHIVDVSIDSINSCIEYCENKISSHHLINDALKIKKLKVDLIFSNEVIQHFISLEYFNRVLKVWSDLNPKYIAFQVKISNENKEELDYFTGNKYLNGLLLNKNYVIEKMANHNYKLIKYSTDYTLNKIELGYFIFEKNKN